MKLNNGFCPNEKELALFESQLFFSVHRLYDVWQEVLSCVVLLVFANIFVPKHLV